MKLLKLSAAIFCSLFITQGCLEAPGEQESEIDSGLQVYVDQFYKEASARGVNLEDIPLVAAFNDEIIIDGESLCGFGRSNVKGTQTATIDIVRDETCWLSRSDIERENLVFHELGHALLERSHFNRSLPNGARESIMCNPCNNFLLYNQFQEYKRPYYLDELIIGSAGIPEWASVKTNEVGNFTNRFEQSILSIPPRAQASDTAFFALDTSGIFEGNSLLVKSDTVNSENAIGFPIVIDNPAQNDCFDVTLTVDVQTAISGGSGALVALRGNQIANNEREALQEKFELINANDTIRDMEVRLGCVSSEVDELVGFLTVREGTSGKAFFDNIEISVFE